MEITNDMFLIWIELIIIFFTCIFYAIRTKAALTKVKVCKVKEIIETDDVLAYYDIKQYFKTFMMVFLYSFTFLTAITLCIQYFLSMSLNNNINLDILSYIHLMVSILISVYITSRGVLKINEKGITISSLTGKKTYLYKNIELIKRVYINDELGILELILKNKKKLEIDLDSYKENKHLKNFVNTIFEGSKEVIQGEYTFKEEDLKEHIEVRNSINYIILIIILILNFIIFVVFPEPNIELAIGTIVIAILFALNYRTCDVVLKNGMIRYKLWIGTKYKSVKLQDIKNIHLGYEIFEKRKKVVSYVIHLKNGKLVEIPISYIYKKQHIKLLKLLND